MIADTSALVAVLLGEAQGAGFVRSMQEAEVCRMSIGNRLELDIVLDRQGDGEIVREAHRFLRQVGMGE